MNTQTESIARRAAKDIAKGYDIKERIEMAIKEALAQPSGSVEQEPAGVVCVDISNAHMMYGTQYLGQQPDKKTVSLFKDLELGTQLYTTPPQRKPWVSLSDDSIEKIVIATDGDICETIEVVMSELRKLNEGKE